MYSSPEFPSPLLLDVHGAADREVAKGAHGVLFTPAALFVSLLLAFALAVVTYGAAIPSGLFVPCMTIGASAAIERTRAASQLRSSGKSTKREEMAQPPPWRL